jgi:glycosyltransferase involved in cell wall biosynthesis
MNFYLHHKFFQKSKILVKQNPLDKLKITNQYKYPTEELNILYIGQLEKQKGILFLISVLNDLSLKYKFKLFIVGTGGLFNHLKEISQNKPWIVFCGRLDNEDLKNIWQKANLTIVPSLLYENSPTVIYESLVNGVPVVASRIGGIPELVEDNKNGFLFEPKDKENLKEKLIKIFENPQILSNLKSEALKFEPKSPKIYVREILEFLGNFMEFRFLK